MKQIHVGSDIVKISRIANVIDKFADKFINRIFTHHEQLYCVDNIPRYAKRFAAKEAVSKALGVGIGKKLSWLDIEVVQPHQANKADMPTTVKPTIKIHRSNIYTFSLSMSHDGDYAIANVIAYC